MAKRCVGPFRWGQTHGVHVVAAYLPATGVTLAQLTVDQKPNEATGVPLLVARLDLTGMVITGDAMQCQQALSRQIMGYLWCVKDNQPTLLADIQQVFAPRMLLPGWSDAPPDRTTARTVEKGHGWIDERVITVCSMLAGYSPWPGLAQGFKLERTVIDGLGRQTSEVRSGVTSLPSRNASAQRVLNHCADGMGIENGLHYQRYVIVQEDASVLRRDGPQVLAAFNNAVMGVVGQHGERNLAAVQGRFVCGFDQAINCLRVKCGPERLCTCSG